MFYDATGTAYRILGVYRIRRGKGIGNHSGRDFATLSYRISGSSRFFCEGKEHLAGSGCTVFLPQDTPFRRVSPEPEDLIGIHLKCEGEPLHGIGVETETEALAPLFEQLCALWEEGGAAYYNRCMALLYTVFGELQARKETDGEKIPSAIAPGVALLRRRFRDPSFRLSEAAQASFVSEVYFRRVYRKTFGVSPHEALAELRFAYAASLLRSGYYSTEETARLSGFSDGKYFRTAFTRRFGKSPAALKKVSAG